MTFAGPGTFVLRPVVDEKQDRRGREVLDQMVEKGLRLGVDPVQILEDDHERLHLTLPEQQAATGVQGPSPTLPRVESEPVFFCDEAGEERSEWRVERHESLVERAQALKDTLLHLLRVVSTVDGE